MVTYLPHHHITKFMYANVGVIWCLLMMAYTVAHKKRNEAKLTAMFVDDAGYVWKNKSKSEL